MAAALSVFGGPVLGLGDRLAADTEVFGVPAEAVAHLTPTGAAAEGVSVGEGQFSATGRIGTGGAGSTGGAFDSDVLRCSLKTLEVGLGVWIGCGAPYRRRGAFGDVLGDVGGDAPDLATVGAVRVVGEMLEIGDVPPSSVGVGVRLVGPVDCPAELLLGDVASEEYVEMG
ncbi:MAG: hypothetical protein QY307_00235 [Acidimicrobiia bacterium]|nr:MAG: hypothetical protein QY307_00235 [Acidimicrobiia bacterium]